MDKKDFTDFRIEDLLMDESFVNYCLQKNEADEAFWKEWFLRHPEKASLRQEAIEMLQMLSLTLPENEYKAELERIKAGIQTEVIPLTKSLSIVRFLNWKKLVGAAAVLIFCVGGYVLFRQAGSKQPRLTERYNKENIPLVFTLSDNTVVTLASHSTLRYPINFGDEERKVYLRGDAGFIVTHNTSHPFTVYEDDIVVTDLGTKFNVRQQGDSVLVVELLEGKLQVETVNSSGSPLQSIVLSPSENATYSRYGKKLSKETMNRGAASIQNHFVFHQADFEEVARQIKHAFGITVINQSKKGAWRFTAEFTNATADEIVENICRVEHLEREARGDTILIK